MRTRALIFLLSIAVSYGDERPIVKTSLGTIKGHIQTSFLGRKFAAFEGIPFAKPPIGERRFEAPEPAEPWTGTWDARHTTVCAQSQMAKPNLTEGDEDCLQVNVYVPKEHPNPEDKLEVVVHIHGGAYMYGSGHGYIDAKVLMDQDIIFVTFNYRLGILGFLSTEDEVVPGNNGLKDQVLALKWVQNNIASFGGDPKSVTLSGLSAGGASTHLHYFSLMSRGLFHRGFSQSGVALNSWSLQKEALKKTKMLADSVGCSTGSTKSLVECLKQKPYKQLLTKMGLFLGTNFGLNMLPLGPFGPIVEKGTNAFLNKQPYEVLKKGDLYDVPWILSNTAHEGFLPLLLGGNMESVGKNWEVLAPIMLDFNYTLDPNQWSTASKKIKEYYCGQDTISTECFGRMFGDRIFLADAEDAVRLHAKAVKSPVYYYLFGYPGDDENKYVGHGFDAKYFYGPIFIPKPLTENELKMREVLFKMLMSYVKTGTPVVDGVDWKPTGFERLTYLDVRGFGTEDFEMKSVEELTPFKFWKSVGFKEHENLGSVRDEL